VREGTLSGDRVVGMQRPAHHQVFAQISLGVVFDVVFQGMHDVCCVSDVL
jgi:hypothetical protein